MEWETIEAWEKAAMSEAQMIYPGMDISEIGEDGTVYFHGGFIRTETGAVVTLQEFSVCETNK